MRSAPLRASQDCAACLPSTTRSRRRSAGTSLWRGRTSLWRGRTSLWRGRTSLLPVRTTSFAVTDHISCAPYGVQQGLGKSLVDLRAQPRNVHIDDIGLRIEVVVPDIFQEHRARHHLAGMLHEIFE